MAGCGVGTVLPSGRASAGFVSVRTDLTPPVRCMSTAPRKCAPSAIATRGEMMSPSTDPLSRMSTFSLAVTFPVISPSTMTALANTSALMRPFGPTVSTWSRSSTRPSTYPSTVRSSLPFSSPLITTDLPMLTTSRMAVRGSSERWGTAGAVAVCCTGGAAGTGTPAAGPDGFTASSRFHIVETSAIRVFCWNAPPRNNELAAGEPSPVSIWEGRKDCLLVLVPSVRGDATLLETMRIYLDHNATTPPAETVVEAVTRAMRDLVGNGSSVHSFGQQAKGAIDGARTSVAALVGGDPAEIVFTGGGTESINLAIRGAAEALEPTGRRGIVVSGIEHEAVLQTSRALARRGWTLTVVPVESNGVVSAEAVREA